MNRRFVRPWTSVFIKSSVTTGAPTPTGALFLNTPGLTDVVRPTVCAEADPKVANIEAVPNATTGAIASISFFIEASPCPDGRAHVISSYERRPVNGGGRRAPPGVSDMFGRMTADREVHYGSFD